MWSADRCAARADVSGLPSSSPKPAPRGSSGPKCSTTASTTPSWSSTRFGDRIVASIAGEIETLERNRAILKPPNSLDAWEAHHRGLWHMYRFNQTDNERAQHFFETAVRLDPTFAR